ncbi:hypothetical protein AWV79_02595 [Cupriavidus sp. UYMMa02A]|nr:hypothetical protein AWV79_02595 [Cupriavidus sp. UYMMa02A]
MIKEPESAPIRSLVTVRISVQGGASSLMQATASMALRNWTDECTVTLPLVPDGAYIYPIMIVRLLVLHDCMQSG